MKVIKFSINESYYDDFKKICAQDNVTIKRKLNVLLSKDRNPVEIKSYFPEDAHENKRKLTLKVNEELYKGLMKNCGRFELHLKDYVPYLIYRFGLK